MSKVETRDPDGPVRGLYSEINNRNNKDLIAEKKTT